MAKLSIPFYKVIIIGDTSTGKSCLLNSLLSEQFNEEELPTIGVDFKAKMIEINGTIIKLQLWDTAGQERFRNVTTAYYHEAKGIILVYDVTNEKSFDNIINWLSLVNDRAPADVKKILLGTKCDIENKRKVPKERGEQLAVKYKMKFLETSSKMNINIEEAFFLLALVKMYSIIKLPLLIYLLIELCYGKPPSKIVGGVNSQPGSVPYIVSLTVSKTNQHICGGSLISLRHVLTAAHCFADVNDVESLRKIIIRTGSTNHKKDGENHTIFKLLKNADFTSGSENRWRNDIAVVVLTDSIKPNIYQTPISLPTSLTPARVIGQVSGWGQLSKTSESSIILQTQFTTIISNSECSARSSALVLDTQICGYNAIGAGFCMGDSGGPLVYNNEIVGIASFTIPCGTGMPDKYTRVDKYLEFIYKAMQM
ncbi:hypothetical protein HCN44_000485 [Aphidius gifuensis]|uniref:Peptidase S1 domain-containing protein n=2 Tax=Aphidius gifuensis TaxID=684658 RepID=A0A835CRX6_APHGI|nr:hypothetical protein HCN44_000485 [Aphidius gifuensis]